MPTPMSGQERTGYPAALHAGRDGLHMLCDRPRKG